MDLLTDLLRQAGLRRRLLDLRHFSASTSLKFPCDKSLGLHVVTQGRVYLHAANLKQPLALQAGDLAVMARGCHHVVSSRATLRAAEVEVMTDSWADRTRAALPSEPAGAVVSGAYQFWHAPIHPVFGDMPDWFVLRADSLPRLGPLALTVNLLAEEAGQRHIGADTIVHGLLDVIFTYLLREMLSRQGAAGANWSRGLRDPLVQQVLMLMHGDCSHPWTLEELAGRTGLSRTGLAQRFRETMGDTPLSYLRALRMQNAMRILSETDKTLEQVALEVGYQDAFSFSKVFKRSVGVAPREFRRQDAQDKSSPWRFKSGEAGARPSRA